MKVAWDQAPQWGEKAAGQIGKISASEASRAVPLGSLRSPIFFSSPGQCGARAWSQAKIKALGKLKTA